MGEEFPSLCGKFLIAMPGMGDTRFDRSVIYICAHTHEGAMGFIINQIMEAPSVSEFLHQLEIITEAEQANLPKTIANQEIYVGGPVEPGRGFVIHTPEFQSDSTLSISDNVRLTATLEVLRAIATGKGPQKVIMALGYSGWSAGQLEDEISSNGWLTVDADEAILFNKDHKRKYTDSLALLGIDETLLSSDAGHA